MTTPQSDDQDELIVQRQPTYTRAMKKQLLADLAEQLSEEEKKLEKHGRRTRAAWNRFWKTRQKIKRLLKKREQIEQS